MNDTGIDIQEALKNEESILLKQAGTYLFAIEGAQARTSKQNGPCAQIRFRVADGEMEGKVFVGIFSLLPQAIWRFKELIEACGKDSSAIQNASELTGSKLRMEVFEDDYRGEKRLKPGSFESADQQ